MFHGFGGLMTLSQREGVDIRPTLLRVLTDLYVQTNSHTDDEERQFVELASRLIDGVDDATRAAVRARLSIYPHTPREIAWKLRLKSAPVARQGSLRSHQQHPDETYEIEVEADFEDLEIVSEPEVRTAPTLSMQPDDASKLIEMFLAASSNERAGILHGLTDAPLKPSTRVDPRRAARAVTKLEQAALVADTAEFTAELADALILTLPIATQIVNDAGGELLACSVKALGMPSEAFQRVLLFLNPARGSSVLDVYRLARLYDTISERSALIMLSAWRGATIAMTRAKYRSTLYDDERQRARTSTGQTRPADQTGVGTITRNTSNGSSGR